MTKTLLAGGCSFTYGHELSDDDRGTRPSNKTWSAHLSNSVQGNYFCVARAGSGNSGIARRIFEYVSNTQEECVVLVMWSFASRYDWAMPRHRLLENTRWTSITPWDTAMNQREMETKLAGSEVILDDFKRRREEYRETNVGTFADSLYRYAANQYHETYLSWKSIVWLQNILEKKRIPFMFTLADNTLFYDVENLLYQDDSLMRALYKEIDFSNWYSFGERMMGFNQWATLNDYAYGTTHPLDDAHKDAYKLMTPKFNEIFNTTIKEKQ
jgi:hypothetical protein